jgi:D-glycero-alpha-D-manno-heptose-7-phosphate kinase
MVIEATTPNRMDLAGGTLDLYPLYLFEDWGLTLNAAIDLGSYVRLEARRDRRIHILSKDTGEAVQVPSLEVLPLGGKLDLIARALRFYKPRVGVNVTTHNKAPHGSGLGASSSLLIALSAAICRLNGQPYDAEFLVRNAADLEAQCIRVPTGKQDYYAAVHGGVNAIWFRVGLNEVEPLFSPEEVPELESRIILSFTGQSRFSGATNWDMMRAYIDGIPATRESMHNIKRTAVAMLEALRKWNWERFSQLIGEEWENRRRLADGVSTPQIEKVMNAAKEAGAAASKICGAGGGGAMITYADPSRRAAVEEALTAAGAQVLNYHIAREGLQVAEVLD